MQDDVRRRILAWYRRNRRDLPWRATPDPYAILVSEVMLQQTRIDVALPYYRRWMERFPTLEALAQAGEEEVLRAWTGLGYYRRARNLHRTARLVVGELGGRIPATSEGLRRLPGVGEYTAGAVASIAFGERVPAVDGNVQRVASRILAIRTDAGSAAGRRRLRDAAAAWVPEGSPGDWNQALMELGAVVCTPRRPRCGDCPAATACRAHALGKPERFPMATARKAVATERRQFAAVVHRRRLLAVRSADGLLGGMWLLPGGPAGTPLATLVRRQTGVRVRVAGKPGEASHAFSHRRWSMVTRRATVVATGGDGDAGWQVRWIPLDELGEAAWPTAMRRALASVGISAGAPARGPP